MAREPARAKERRLVAQARVWHGGGEAEPERGIHVPTWVTPGLRHEATSAVLGGKKEVVMDMIFTERDCLSSRGQSVWSPGSVWFSEGGIGVPWTRWLSVLFHAASFHVLA